MLKSLYIKNFTLIDELEVSFNDGLNIITGETGSGKSILIDAIDLAFGARALKDQIKTGQNKAIIELQIKLSDSFPSSILQENGIDVEGDNILVLSREINQSATRSRINGVMVTQNYVQKVKDELIDIHSQHQTYSYIQPKKHIELLDNYGNNEHQELLSRYKEVYSSLTQKQKQYEFLKNESQSLAQKIDFLRFQIQEIESVEIESPKELEELNEDLNLLTNAEELKEYTYSSYYALYESESSIIDVLGSLENKLVKASEYDKNLSEIANIIAYSSESLKDASTRLRGYSENLEVDAGRLNEVEERIGVLEKLRRKYGKTLDEVLNQLEMYKNELLEIEYSTEQLESLADQISELDKIAKELSTCLSKSRKNLAVELSKLICNELTKLEMPKAQFYIDIKELGIFTQNGKDSVEFLITTNVGEPLKPLVKVASGGEISRIMLAVKTVFAKADGINSVIFDEIDTGISGKASHSVAEELSHLAKTHQILCITHQPIIAAMADNHFYVEKIQDNTRTYSTIKPLNEQERHIAISKLVGADSKDSMEFAKKLLDKSSEYKKHAVKV